MVGSFARFVGADRLVMPKDKKTWPNTRSRGSLPCVSEAAGKPVPPHEAPPDKGQRSADGAETPAAAESEILCREQSGGLLKHYYRKAA